MTSRFILDLHEAADPRAGHDACADLCVGTLSTTMFPGPTPGSFHARAPSISILFGTTTCTSDWIPDENEYTAVERKSPVWSHDEQLSEVRRWYGLLTPLGYAHAHLRMSRTREYRDAASQRMQAVRMMPSQNSGNVGSSPTNMKPAMILACARCW